jgi:hypothetical protein
MDKQKVSWSIVDLLAKFYAYSFLAIWISFPFWMTASLAPVVIQAWRDMGQELSLLQQAFTIGAIPYGLLCCILNVGYLYWRFFFIRRHKAKEHKKAIVYWCLFFTNFALFVWFVCTAMLSLRSYGPLYRLDG